MQKKIFVGIFVIISFICFYFFGTEINYLKHKEIKFSIVNHPEFIPTAKTVNLSSAGFSNIVSDFYWLGAIQYIGSNAIGSVYKKYLFQMLNLITDLNPYFTYPYRIGELLLPEYNPRYENLSADEIQKNVKQAEFLGKKGINNTCDLKKVNLIKKEFDLKKLWTEDQYKDPCVDPNIPYYLGYLYYMNLFDSKKSSLYYKVTSANNDGPKGSRVIAAIMEGKAGNREKSIIMFLSLAQGVTENKDMCGDFSKQLGYMMLESFKDNKIINGKTLSQIEIYREYIAKKLGTANNDGSMIDNDILCSNYLNKAVREINLKYLEQSDKKFFEKEKRHAVDSKELYAKGYIDYSPIDFQKTDKENFGIIYYYNKDIGNWDYKMGLN